MILFGGYITSKTHQSLFHKYNIDTKKWTNVEESINNYSNRNSYNSKNNNHSSIKNNNDNKINNQYNQ